MPVEKPESGDRHGCADGEKEVKNERAWSPRYCQKQDWVEGSKKFVWAPSPSCVGCQPAGLFVVIIAKKGCAGCIGRIGDHLFVSISDRMQSEIGVKKSLIWKRQPHATRTRTEMSQHWALMDNQGRLSVMDKKLLFARPFSFEMGG